MARVNPSGVPQLPSGFNFGDPETIPQNSAQRFAENRNNTIASSGGLHGVKASFPLLTKEQMTELKGKIDQALKGSHMDIDVQNFICLLNHEDGETLVNNPLWSIRTLASLGVDHKTDQKYAKLREQVLPKSGSKIKLTEEQVTWLGTNGGAIAKEFGVSHHPDVNAFIDLAKQGDLNTLSKCSEFSQHALGLIGVTITPE